MMDELEALRRLRPDPEVSADFLGHERRELMAYVVRSLAESAPAQRIIPHLIYDDVAAALDWLSRAFGFREPDDSRLVDTDGTIGHAELELDGATVMLGPPSVHGESPARGVSTMLAVYVDDVDAHCARARAAGAEVLLEPADQPWGERRYQCRDPEGHQWSFHQRLSR